MFLYQKYYEYRFNFIIVLTEKIFKLNTTYYLVQKRDDMPYILYYPVSVSVSVAFIFLLYKCVKKPLSLEMRRLCDFSFSVTYPHSNM